MNKVKILFFTADPYSVPPYAKQRLGLDAEFRQVRKRVYAARFGRILDFDWRLAARTSDLQHALEETRPQIVHFSGHGGNNGLVFVSADGKTARPVDTAVLRELFEKDARRIRLVVLTACDSRSQAEAIKEVVGCAIGTRDRISDEASIAFNAKFYSAIASGRSVKDAFERARMSLRLEYPQERDIVELLHRDDVDPAKIVFVSRTRRFAPIGAAATMMAAIAGGVITFWPEPPEPPAWEGVRLGDCTPTVAGPASRSISTPAGSLEEAKAQCASGNYDSAFVLFKQAADAGNLKAKGFVGIAYLSGEGTARDPKLGIHLLREASYDRDPRAMNTLAIANLNGEQYGINSNPARAKYWFKIAADSGYAEAMLNLGRLYLDAHSDSLALVWFRKAVDAGLVDAMVDVGWMYEHGRGMRRDSAEAFRWYQRAAAAGSPAGMAAVGRAFQQGTGVGRDYGQARAWLEKGACAGSAVGMNDLGELYLRGLGVERDRDRAIALFRQAAEAGSPEAASNLEKLDAERPGGVRGLLGLSGSSPLRGCDVAQTAMLRR